MANQNTNIILSLILGVLLGLLLFKVFPFNYRVHGPNSKDIIDKIYKVNNICYKLDPIVTICPGNISMK